MPRLFQQYPDQKFVQGVPTDNVDLTGYAKTAGSVLPGIGDAISAYDAYKAFKEGNYGEAGLNALGILPFVPSLGGMTKDISKKVKTLLPEELNINWLHGTSPENKAAIELSGEFNPNSGKRFYSYSELGPETTYLAPQNSWWLDKNKAISGRAALYDSSVATQVDKNAKIAKIDSLDDLNTLAKEVGYKDSEDLLFNLMSEDLGVVQQAKSFKNYEEWYKQQIKSVDESFHASEEDKQRALKFIKEHSTKQDYLDILSVNKRSEEAINKLKKAGYDGMYIGNYDLNSPDVNYMPAPDQLAIFNQKMIKPIKTKTENVFYQDPFGDTTK